MELKDPAGQENQDFPLGDDPRPQRNLDKVLEDLGFGTFQLWAYAAIGFGMNANGFWFYTLGSVNW